MNEDLIKSLMLRYKTQSEVFQVCFIVKPEEEVFLKQSNKRMEQFANDDSQCEVCYRA